jgi:hypothetical protein
MYPINCSIEVVGLAVALQICILEKLGSNLGWYIGYPYWGFS